MAVFNIIKMLVRFFLLFVFRIKIVGKQNMPKDIGVIAAINHRSNWDVLIAGACTPRRLGFMAKSELFKNKLFGWLITKLGAFPVQRGKGDIGAIKAALTRLRDNDVVAMFPEGKRVRNNEVVSAKPGAVMLATKAQVPIVPIRIIGKYSWMSKIVVVIGEPVEYTQYLGQKLSVEVLQGLSDDLLKKIKLLEAE